jgi:uncharacterized protein (TIGR03000 family)
MMRGRWLAVAAILVAVALFALPTPSWAQHHGGGGHYSGGGHYGGYGYGHGYYGGWGGYNRGWGGIYLGYGPYYGNYGYYPWRSYAYTPGYYGYSDGWYAPNYYYYDYAPSYYSAPSDFYSSAPSAGGAGFYGTTEQSDPNVAHLTVTVPADAQLWFDGAKTSQTGETRYFVTPALTPGKNYSYEVRAKWMENGQEVDRTKRVQVHAGEQDMVSFSSTTGTSTTEGYYDESTPPARRLRPEDRNREEFRDTNPTERTPPATRTRPAPDRTNEPGTRKPASSTPGEGSVPPRSDAKPSTPPRTNPGTPPPSDR